MGKGIGGLIGCSTGAILGGLFNGGLNAAFGAASGATGAAILNAAGHTGYSVLEATQMGAIGNAIVGGSIGLCAGGLAGSLIGCGIFGNDNAKDDDKKGKSGNFLLNAITYVGFQTLGGVLGYAIKKIGTETIMDLGKTAASLAVGSAVTMIPASCVTTCIAIPLVLAGVACTLAFNGDKDVTDEQSYNEKEITLPSPV